MKTEYYLFLDDIRSPNYINTQPNTPKNKKWTIVRSFNQFVKVIKELGVPAFISYDHDLCMNAVEEFLRANNTDQYFNYNKKMAKTGMDCLNFMLEFCEKNNIPHPPYIVHSSNWICARLMIEKINKYNAKKSQ